MLHTDLVMMSAKTETTTGSGSNCPIVGQVQPSIRTTIYLSFQPSIPQPIYPSKRYHLSFQPTFCPPFVRQPIYLSTHLFIFPTIYPSNHLYVQPSICPIIYMSNHLSVQSSMCTTIYMYNHISVQPSICTAIYLSNHLSVPPYFCATIFLSNSYLSNHLYVQSSMSNHLSV